MSIKQISHLFQANCRVQVNSSGTEDPAGSPSYVPVGLPRTSVTTHSSTNTAYVVRLVAGAGTVATLSLLTGNGSAGPATGGTQQSLDFAALPAGPALTAGNLDVTFTSARYPWVNKTIVVPVTNGWTRAQATTAAINAVSADSDIAQFFALGYLDKIAAANDATLEVDIQDGTPSTGFPGLTSTILDAGVAPNVSTEQSVIKGVGTASANGTLTVTVTHPFYAVSESVTVSVLSGDAPSVWIDKVVTALEANAVLDSCAIFQRTGNFLRMYDRFSNNNGAGDMTMAFDAGVTGISAATSALVQVGAGGGTFYDADGKDVNGETITTLGRITSFAIWPHPDAVLPGNDIAGATHYTLTGSAAGGTDIKMHSMEFLARAAKGEVTLPDDSFDTNGTGVLTFTVDYPIDILVEVQGYPTI